MKKKKKKCRGAIMYIAAAMAQNLQTSGPHLICKRPTGDTGPLEKSDKSKLPPAAAVCCIPCLPLQADGKPEHCEVTCDGHRP